MTHALSRRIIAPLLMIALLVPLMIPLPAQAANSRDAAFNNDAADSSQHWSYGQNLAGADITDSKASSRHNTVTVYLTAEEQAMASDGYLSYIGSAHIGANGSRTVDRSITTTCYDAGGNALPTGNYHKEGSTYWVAHANYDYSTGNVLIPAGTTSITYTVSVSIGTPGDLELENMVFAINSNAPEGGGYQPIGSVEDIQLYEYYDDNGQSSGDLITYHDIYQSKPFRGDLSDADAFYRDALLNEDNLNHWAQLAYQTFKSNKNTYWDWAGGGFDKDFGSGVYTDLINDLTNRTGKRENSNVIMESTGLTAASSFDNAIDLILDNQASLRNRNAGGDDFRARHSTVSLGSDALDSKQQPVFFTAVNVSDAYGGTYKYGYNSMGIIFYDFKVTPLIDDAPFNTLTTSSNEPLDQVSTSDLRNDNLTESDFSQTIGTTLSTDTSNTITNSSATTRTRGFGVEIGFEEKFGVKDNDEATIRYGFGYDFSASEMFETSESDTVSYQESYSDTTATSITVPAHTLANIRTTTETAQLGLAYDCPVAINYKVAIVSMCGSYYDDNAAILDMTSADYNHKSFITVFGSETDGTDAHQNLGDRVDNRDINGYENSHGYTSLHTMDGGTLATELWLNTILGQGAPTTSASAPVYTGLQLAQMMGTTKPMSVSGARMNTTSNVTQVQLAEFTPTKALKNVWVTNIKVQLRPNAIQVPVGGEYYLIDITCGGFDEDNVPYYGFQSSWGSWELLDDRTGQPLAPSIAEITRSATTGKDKLHVYQPYDGIVLKYSIPEDTYKSAEEDDYTTNADLDSTAYVDVVVEGTYSAAAPYEDVAEDAWYSDSVDFMDDQDYMDGTSDTTFSPDSNTTRAMMAAILWRMAGEETPQGSSGFTDLDADWYRDAVAWATENGITQGTSTTTFSPDNHLTREQFVTMLYRYAEKKGLDLSSYITPQEETTLDLDDAVVQEDYTTQGGDLNQFPDSGQVSDYAERAMQWAVSQGIVTGTPEGTLDPQGTATRAEMATMLARYSNN